MKYIRSKYPNIYYREHASRRNGPRPDRYIAIRYYDGNGKRHMSGLGWTSEGWTMDKAAEILGELKRNIKTGTGPQSLAERRKLLQEEREQKAQAEASISVDRAAELYMEWARNNKKSWQDDEERLRLHIRPVLGTMLMTEVVLDDLDTLRRVCEKKKVGPKHTNLSPATVKQVLTLTRRLFNWSIDRSLIPGPNPAEKLRMPKPENERTRFLSRDEADRLLKVCAEYDMEIHDICLLAIYTGMRSGEISNLQWQHVDYDSETIWVEGKTGRRPAYLTDRLTAMLRRREGKGKRPGDHVFLNQRGIPIKDLSHRFETVAAKAELNVGVTDKRQRAVFHTLRHTFASWLAQQGVPLLTIRDLMGHKTLAMVMRYAHLAPNQARAAANSLDQHSTSLLLN